MKVVWKDFTTKYQKVGKDEVGHRTNGVINFDRDILIRLTAEVNDDKSTYQQYN